VATPDRLQVSIPKELAESARNVAALEGKSLAALVSEILGPALALREKALLAARLTAIADAPPVEPPKRGRPKKGGGS